MGIEHQDEQQRVTFKIDAGVQCNVISKKTNNKVSRQPLTQWADSPWQSEQTAPDKVSRQSLTKWADSPWQSEQTAPDKGSGKASSIWRPQSQGCGKTVLACGYKENYPPIESEVIEQDVPSVLKLKTCTVMKLVKCIDSASNKTEDNDVVTGCISDDSPHPNWQRP